MGTTFFALAVLHIFLAPKINKISHRFPKGSFYESLFHLLGEVELVFGIWAALFFCVVFGGLGHEAVVNYIEGTNFTEPLFVFTVMVISSTRPVLYVARKLIFAISGVLQTLTRMPTAVADFSVCLIVGPLAGSFITEPAAMTVTALLMHGMLKEPSENLLYAILALLFVNVSIGGALTHFAAPPILMVAQTWGWDFQYIFSNFGWKAALAVALNTCLYVIYFRNEIQSSSFSLKALIQRQETSEGRVPILVWLIHLLFLFLLVATSHHSKVFMGIFLLFLGVTTVTKKYQDTLRFRESLLVAFFLGGIILFGSFQQWWLQPLLTQLDNLKMFIGATLLTAITDNAALTYLGSQVVGLSEASKYALVAGAIAGGGLTIIANAPNAAGYSVLQSRFALGFNAVKLLRWALLPTAVAVAALGFL